MYINTINKKPDHISVFAQMCERGAQRPALSFPLSNTVNIRVSTNTSLYIHRHKCSVSDEQIALLCPRKLGDYPPEP